MNPNLEVRTYYFFFFKFEILKAANSMKIKLYHGPILFHELCLDCTMVGMFATLLLVAAIWPGKGLLGGNTARIDPGCPD